jgi:hypothetical protein
MQALGWLALFDAAVHYWPAVSNNTKKAQAAAAEVMLMEP